MVSKIPKAILSLWFLLNFCVRFEGIEEVKVSVCVCACREGQIRTNFRFPLLRGGGVGIRHKNVDATSIHDGMDLGRDGSSLPSAVGVCQVYWMAVHLGHSSHMEIPADHVVSAFRPNHPNYGMGSGSSAARKSENLHRRRFHHHQMH